VPGHRTYAVGKYWVTKIKHAPGEAVGKSKFRTLKHLRSDEAKAAEELKAMKIQERAASKKKRAARKSLTKALPAAGAGQDEDEEEDPADAFS
jgi:hypothetical protein